MGKQAPLGQERREENGQRRRRDLHAMCSEAGIKNAVASVEKER